MLEFFKRLGFSSVSKNNSDSENCDQHTYFLTSPSATKFCVSKLHFCSWLFSSGYECLEVGVQCKISNLSQDIATDKDAHIRPLSIDFWIPWLSNTDTVEDLYPAISKKENAAFIFNDSCPTSSDCVAWKNSGQILEFSHRGNLTVVPLEFKSSSGRITVTANIPNAGVKGDVYFRFCIKVPKSRFSMRRKEVSKEVYAYNINYGQLRNQPADLRSDELCKVGDVFCIHILPAQFLQTFLDPKSFENVRFLEADKYCHYAEGSSVLQQCVKTDPMIVSFNKSPTPKNAGSRTGGKVSGIAAEDRSCSFFSLFERDCIGPRQTGSNVLVNVLCSLGCAALLSIVGFFWGQHTKNSTPAAEVVQQSETMTK